MLRYPGFLHAALVFLHVALYMLNKECPALVPSDRGCSIRSVTMTVVACVVS